MTSSTSPFYPWKRAKQWTSRDILPIAKSFGCLYSSNFLRSLLWFARLIGAEHENMGYCGKNDNIGHCGPNLVRNDPKTQEESFSSSDRIDQKLRQKILKSWVEDIAKTHSENKYVMSVWSCVNGHFTAKPHWSRVEFVHVFSWFTFCPWLGPTDLRGSSLSFENGPR